MLAYKKGDDKMRSRNRRFSLWLNDKELSYFTKQAENAGLNKESYLRSLIMGSEVKPRPPDEYVRVAREINAIGNNINQIARTANITQAVTQEQIADVMKLLNEAIRTMRSIR